MCRSVWLIQDEIQLEIHLGIALFMFLGVNDWTALSIVFDLPLIAPGTCPDNWQHTCRMPDQIIGEAATITTTSSRRYMNGANYWWPLFFHTYYFVDILWSKNSYRINIIVLEGYAKILYSVVYVKWNISDCNLKKKVLTDRLLFRVGHILSDIMTLGNVTSHPQNFK